MTNINKFEGGDILYHFTKKNYALEDILLTKKLKLSTLKQYNDPYEYKALPSAFNWAGKLNEEDIKDKFNYLINEYNKYVLHNVKIKCFSVNNHTNQELLKPTSCPLDYCPFPLDKPYKNIRLWHQYAENHYGVCFVISKKKLLEINYPIFSVYDYKAQEVFYQKNIVLNFPSIDLNINIHNNIEVETFIKNKIDEILHYKSMDFIDEQEFRIWIHDTDDKIENLEINNTIVGIILGDRFPEIYIPLIIEFCKNNNNIPCYKAFFDNSQLIFLEYC